LPTSPHKIRVSNTTDSPSWSLSLAATSGPSAKWVDGAKNYDFNDPLGSGCTGGQLTVSSASASLTPQSGCSASGVSLGSNASFSQGVVDSLTIASASSPALVDCYWDISNIPLTQKIPASQRNGNYSLGLTITITAS
jgi:hypothetical protein